jgi:hypothetical protein
MAVTHAGSSVRLLEKQCYRQIPEPPLLPFPEVMKAKRWSSRTALISMSKLDRLNPLLQIDAWTAPHLPLTAGAHVQLLQDSS